jgi:hypothetical protein
MGRGGGDLEVGVVGIVQPSNSPMYCATIQSACPASFGNPLKALHTSALTPVAGSLTIGKSVHAATYAALTHAGLIGGRGFAHRGLYGSRIGPTLFETRLPSLLGDAETWGGAGVLMCGLQAAHSRVPAVIT